MVEQSQRVQQGGDWGGERVTGGGSWMTSVSVLVGLPGVLSLLPCDAVLISSVVNSTSTRGWAVLTNSGSQETTSFVIQDSRTCMQQHLQGSQWIWPGFHDLRGPPAFWNDGSMHITVEDTETCDVGDNTEKSLVWSDPTIWPGKCDVDAVLHSKDSFCP